MTGIKKSLLLIIGLHVSVVGYSQSRNVDSLRVELSRTTDDLKRFDLLNNILLDVTSFRGDNVDSLVTLDMLAIAQKINNDSLKAISYNWLGSYFFQMKGDHASALEYYYKALPLAEITKDKRRISSIYFDMALVYFSMNDNVKALEVTRKGGENLPDKDHPLYPFMVYQYQSNMAEYFLDLKNIDSASYYIEISSEALVHFDNSPSYLFTDYLNRAAINALSNNVDEADDYFTLTEALQDSIENLSSKLYFYKFYLSFLLSQNRTTIGIQQGKKLLNIGTDNNNNNMKLTAAQYLRQFYDAQNQTDSAYYYSRMEAQINEDIFSQDNKNRMESLILNDQLRRNDEKNKIEAYQAQLKQYALLVGLGMVLIIALILFRNMREKQKTNTILERTLSDLKSTQAQLVQQEKLASLGQLTAGIAHEIKNPLNFVNNFASVSLEMVDELKQDVDGFQLSVVSEDSLQKTDNRKLKTRIDENINDLKTNLGKIHEHGTRADSIVKSMLMHSRGGSGKKEPTDINALVQEYANLAFHGMRAGKNPITVDIRYELDSKAGSVPIVAEDFSRVILNLCNNAFDAMKDAGRTENRKLKTENILTIRTKRTPDSLQIDVEDNGPGIPDEIKDKILQPFFTTKKGTEGTGLGLSISHDIVKSHGGTLDIHSQPGQTVFTIKLNR